MAPSRLSPPLHRSVRDEIAPYHRRSKVVPVHRQNFPLESTAKPFVVQPQTHRESIKPQGKWSEGRSRCDIKATERSTFMNIGTLAQESQNRSRDNLPRAAPTSHGQPHSSVTSINQSIGDNTSGHDFLFADGTTANDSENEAQDRLAQPAVMPSIPLRLERKSAEPTISPSGVDFGLSPPVGQVIDDVTPAGTFTNNSLPSVTSTVAIDASPIQDIVEASSRPPSPKFAFVTPSTGAQPASTVTPEHESNLETSNSNASVCRNSEDATLRDSNAALDSETPSQGSTLGNSPESTPSVSQFHDEAEYVEQPSASSSSPRRENLECFQAKVRGLDHHMKWYVSMGTERLQHPRAVPSPTPGTIFLHKWPGCAGPQIWVLKLDLEWAEAKVGDVHPSLPDRRLHILINGAPRWVTKKTASTYRGRKKLVIFGP